MWAKDVLLSHHHRHAAARELSRGGPEIRPQRRALRRPRRAARRSARPGRPGEFRDIWPASQMRSRGVNRPEDAVKAIEYGVDGIIVSNQRRTKHGQRRRHHRPARGRGRRGDRATVILDLLRAAVPTSRLAPRQGRADRARHALRQRHRRWSAARRAKGAISLLRNELDKTMAYTGCCSVDELSTDIFFGAPRTARAAAHGRGIGPNSGARSA